MNIHQLKKSLEEIGVDPDFASLYGEARDESLVLEHPNSGGWCVYYSERGQRSGERWFITEEEACQFIFNRLSIDPSAKKHTLSNPTIILK